MRVVRTSVATGKHKALSRSVCVGGGDERERERDFKWSDEELRQGRIKDVASVQRRGDYAHGAGGCGGTFLGLERRFASSWSALLIDVRIVGPPWCLAAIAGSTNLLGGEEGASCGCCRVLVGDCLLGCVSKGWAVKGDGRSNEVASWITGPQVR